MKRPILQLAAICSLTFALNSSAAVHYVDVNGTNPVLPYTSWATAATNIQDAVGYGGTVLVTNGIYQFSGLGSGPYRVKTFSNQKLQSVNGPAVTVIDGGRSVACVYLEAGSMLSGFTLTNGIGGGVVCENGTAMITNCLIISNSAGPGVSSGTVWNCVIENNTNNYGGGASSSTLVNCCLTGNSASPFGMGGGAISSILTNCILTKNSAGYQGGGAFGSTLFGCIVSDNYCGDYGAGGTFSGTLINCTVINNTGGSYGGVQQSVVENSIVYYNTNRSSNLPANGIGKFTNCCLIPLPSSGRNNFTNPPLFVNLADEDFHLQSNSPCINAGNNSYLTNIFNYASLKTDFDGNPRIVSGTVDIGAYEFQSPSSVLSYVWAQQYGLPTDGSADFIDSDADGMNNWQEWRTGTIPNDPASVLKLMAPANDLSGTTITWQSVSGMNYFIQRSSDLGAQPPFSTIQINVVGQADTTSYTDTDAVGSGPFFYRVGVL